MHGTDFAPEEFVACPPMFVETDDGFALTDAARDLLALMDPPPPTIAERLVSVRAQLTSLAADLPAAVRLLAPHDLLDAVEVLQQATNLAGSCDQAVVAEIDRQGAHEPAGATSTAQLLSDHLRIRPAEAMRRVKTARACTERVSMDGQVLPPLRNQTAAAQAAGAITTDHARTITLALDSLPTALPVETVDAVEAALMELAHKRNASDVAAAGRAARDRFDADNPRTPRNETPPPPQPARPPGRRRPRRRTRHPHRRPARQIPRRARPARRTPTGRRQRRRHPHPRPAAA